MLDKEHTASVQLLGSIRQNSQCLEIDEFVLDFLEIWSFIHEQAPSLNLSNVKTFSKSILDTHILPFYEKHSKKGFLEKYDVYIQNLNSIMINWNNRGRVTFPLRLITYEIIYHEDNLLEFFFRKIISREMSPSIEKLFNFLFPTLINFAIPLTENDVTILKALQNTEAITKDLFKGGSLGDLQRVLEISRRTIIRRVKFMRYLQISLPVHFIDISALGYETYLLSHFKSVPKKIAPYVSYSVDYTFTKISLIHVPLQKFHILKEIQDELEPLFFQQFDRRITTWNLTGLNDGKDGWKIPPPFLHCDPLTNVIAPQPTLSLNLKPDFEGFRPLTPADIKILDFIANTGAIRSKNDLAKAVKVCKPEISTRVGEFLESHLINKVHQFFNIGTDYSISFYISSPSKQSIPWMDHFLSFPKMDVFSATDEGFDSFFGHLKLPPKWFKSFTRQAKTFRNEIPDLKFYYTIEPPTIARWNLSLADTYPKK